MITSSPRFRYYFAFAMLAVLLRLSAQAATGEPAPAALGRAVGSPVAASQRALMYTRYLTVALRLQPHQFVSVRRCTEQQLMALNALVAQPAATPAAYASVEAQYLTSLLPILTEGQYAALVRLREQATLPLVSGSMASRY